MEAWGRGGGWRLKEGEEGGGLRKEGGGLGKGRSLEA